MPFMRIAVAERVMIFLVYLLMLQLRFVRLTQFGPSILHTDSDDEDIIVGSGLGWGSGSGHYDLDLQDEDDDEDGYVSTKPSVLRLSTPSDASRISCIVCSTVGDPSCRDPYRRNESHVQACPSQAAVGGCLKVVTPSGDTYRNCLYGIFATAEEHAGCRVITDRDVGHKFVLNATICICRTSECNGYYGTQRESDMLRSRVDATGEAPRSFSPKLRSGIEKLPNRTFTTTTTSSKISPATKRPLETGNPKSSGTSNKLNQTLTSVLALLFCSCFLH